MQNLLTELRLATREIHERLHVHPALRDLTTPNLTLSYYRVCLERFYGFYHPHERLYAASGHEMLSVFPAMQNLQWLAGDLSRLGIDVRSLPLQSIDQTPLDHEQVLAYLYVREGSNLGGKVITQHLEQKLALRPGIDNRFFWGNGEETGGKWRLFRDRLAFYEDSTNSGRVGSHARALFARLEEWLTQHEDVECTRNPV